ncbi:hypothetical protein [Butyrivibrio sp. VCD2006]|uniref:hypothetical protein n=1 Tax=Butyrivibrio sp. VCD2006 TaxID=1280664 RepID=UPI000418EAD7|nr:hypothetical protein [Butyrivibrio sp. VCD2006]
MGDYKKKVIILIVEGSTDKAALGTIMQEYFSSEEVAFLVVRGDITTELYVTKENIVSRLNDKVEQLMNKYGYDPEDVVEIIHMVDTDGAFIDSESVVDNEAAEETLYYTDHIETKDVNGIVKRNERKSGILEKLYLTGHICDSLSDTGNGIKYRVYYNSCNLEHVLYGELKPYTDEEKEELADDFAEKYEGNVEGFIEFILNPEFAVTGPYKRTWTFIEKEKNSLNRYTNLGIIFTKE